MAQIELSNDNSLTLRKLFNFLLDSVSEDGNWRDFDESWDPIITAVTTELLLDAGIKLTDKWYILRDQYKPITLNKSLSYLNNQIRESGDFGTDLWDTLRLAKLIVAKELKSHFSNYDKLHNYILQQLDTDEFLKCKSEWRGPAFYACAIDYLDLINLTKTSNSVLEKIIALQDSSGCWIGATSREGQPLTSPVWHTSQVITTLQRKGPIKYEAIIKKALIWLQDKQEYDGSWPALRQFEIYFTCYSLLALSKFEYENEIRKGVDYLKSKIDSSGKCSDLGGTLMCCIAFWELTKESVDQNMTFMEYLLATNSVIVTNTLENEIKLLTNDNHRLNESVSEYKQKYRDAEVVITKKQAFFLGVFLVFAGFGGFSGLLQTVSYFTSSEKSNRESVKNHTDIGIKTLVKKDSTKKDSTSTHIIKPPNKSLKK